VGLFDDLLNEKVQATSTFKLTKFEAIYGLLLSAASSDGTYSEAEQKLVLAQISRMKSFIEYYLSNPAAVNDVEQRIYAIAGVTGFDGFVDLCISFIPDEIKKSVYANVVDMLFADGKPDKPELEFMDTVYRKLSIPADDALEIVNVIKLKNDLNY
jgi:hypothetical protein